MKLIQRVYLGIGEKFPEKVKEKIRSLLTYASISMNEDIWLGFASSFSVLLSIVLVLVISFFATAPFLVYSLLLLIFSLASFFTLYFFLSYAVYQRAREIEKMLPDALQLVAANIRAGLTPDKALFLSARKEFGVLSDEINFIGQQTMAGKPVDEALKEFSERVDSKMLRRVVGLISEGLNAGGELASLLDKTADDIRMSEVMQEEIKSNVGAYIIFTMLAILIAAPALYATSINFVGMSSAIRESVGATSIQQAPIMQSTMPTIRNMSQAKGINKNLLMWFSIINLLISSFFGALVVGVLRTGEEKEGLKDFPVFAFIALLLFFIALAGLSAILSGIMNL